jgi:hypothetical protein
MENSKITLASAPNTTLEKLIFEVKSREQKFGYILDTQLLEIAKEITVHKSQYTRQQHAEAIIILAKYRMATLAYNQAKIKEYENKPARARCARCGMPISSKKSLEVGLGVICRKKAGEA